MAVEGEESAIREWFHQLANARENPSALAGAQAWLSGLLIAAEADSTSQGAPALSGVDARTAILEQAANPAAASAELLAFHAPLGLLEGAWLQSAALAANGHRPDVAALSAAYLALLGQDEAASPAFAYRGGLNRQGVSLAKATSWRFAQTPGVGGPALRFASVHLALGLHAARFFPEALGFTLAYGQSASPWRLAALPEPRRSAVLETVDQQAQEALRACPEDTPAWARVWRGYALYQRAEADYLHELEHFARRGENLADRVAGLFRRKRRFAQGYHAGIALGGRRLEDWFADPIFDAEGFLAAFAASPYAATEAGQRPFQRLAAFGGPMFGVFERQELALIEAWLDRAGQKARPLLASEAGRPAAFSLPFIDNPAPALSATRRLNPRELFHRLINQDARADTLASARRRVEKTLARARRAIDRKGPPARQFFDYSPQAFACRVAQIHAEEVARHRPFQPPPRLRREEYAWGVRQFAPAILVDGCWLQHQGEAASQDSRLHRLLHRIYAEELGEGHADWNHPKIYRDLLDELAIDLPATHTWDFARHPGFIDAAFDLPCHLLAIAQFPRTYFPETLGLNLGIELSGLGAGYLRLAEELRHFGINPLIVTLHLSIDNLAGGHAAMAAEAIELYLDETLAWGGDAARQAAWRRIWSGYLSLDTATTRFKWALAAGFCRRFLPGRWLPQIFPA